MKKFDDMVKATKILTWYKDFDGDITEWQAAFYKVWRLQLTYDFAYKIELLETRSSGVYVCIYAKNYEDIDIPALLENIGYTNIETFHAFIGMVYDDCSVDEVYMN